MCSKLNDAGACLRRNWWLPYVVALHFLVLFSWLRVKSSPESWAFLQLTNYHSEKQEPTYLASHPKNTARRLLIQSGAPSSPQNANKSNVFHNLSANLDSLDTKLPVNNKTTEVSSNLNIKNISQVDLAQTSKTSKGNHSKLLCLVLTVSKYHDTRARAVNRTWGRRCDETIFCSNTAKSRDLNLVDTGITSEDKEFVTKRLFSALRKLWVTHGNRFDWIYVADDDTYAVIENLRHYLSTFNPGTEQYLGFMYQTYDTHDTHKTLFFAHGGSGFILSRALFKTLVERGISENGACYKYKQPGATADVNIGWCIKKLGIPYPASTADNKDRERFLKENPISLLSGDTKGELVMFGYRDVIYSPKRAKEVLSEDTIAFHYMRPGDMYLVDFLLYNLARGPVRGRDRFMLEVKKKKCIGASCVPKVN